jgi:hypothetical protein
VIPSTIDAWVAPPALPRPLGNQALLVSPELALVDDELRRDAIALLPELQPFEFLERLRDAAPPDEGVPEWLVVASTPAEPRRRPPGLAVAAVLYLATAILRTCLFNVAVFLGVALLVFVVNVFA